MTERRSVEDGAEELHVCDHCEQSLMCTKFGGEWLCRTCRDAAVEVNDQANIDDALEDGLLDKITF